MLSSHERVETLKLRKRARLSPIPKDFLVFPVQRRPSPCAGWSPLTGSREQTGIHQSADGGGRRVVLKSY